MSGQTTTVRCVPAAPCRVGLMARDLTAAQEFYGTLLGWAFEDGRHDLGPYLRAVVDGVEVAWLGSAEGEWRPPVAWTTFFGTESADETASRIRERGGTVAVGPLPFDAGRMVLAADLAGASFGLWEGGLGSSEGFSAPGAPVWVELRTGDPFQEALFYGEVFRWDERDPARLEVRYEHERVVLRADGHTVAALRRGDPAGAHWEVYFAVRGTDEATARATALGGAVVEPPADTPYGRTARLRDPEGGLFSVITPAPVG
ncbi:VOC family protein [Kitasatospora sp. NPDC096147]|uniref:VOC family protein n=1 Tax=Kitasatospora sp. NPDC096147 TaxID=3364093 RepID=UPI0037FAB14E